MLCQRLQEHPQLILTDLEDSYVLGWQRIGNDLSIDLDVVLLPSHPNYVPPTANEWACFRRGTLTFRGVRDLKGFEHLDASRPAVDATGERDFGNVEDATYTPNGEFRLTLGSAGELSFSAEDVRLVLGAA